MAAQKQEIHIRTSVDLTEEEQQTFLELTLMEHKLVIDAARAEALDFSGLSSVDAGDQGVPGWQYDLGVDLQTVLVLLFAPLPALLLKKMAEEAGKDLWKATKKVLKRVVDRKKGVPIRSIQLQFPSVLQEDIRGDVVVTYLNARYVSDEKLILAMQQCLRQMDAQLELARSSIQTRSEKNDRRLVIHALVEGGNPPRWWVGLR
jgi:hypothetical protein